MQEIKSSYWAERDIEEGSTETMASSLYLLLLTAYNLKLLTNQIAQAVPSEMVMVVSVGI